MIEYICPNCNHRLRVSNSHSGQRSHCTKCGHAITFPDIEGVVTRSAKQLREAERKHAAHTPLTATGHAARTRPESNFSLNWGGLSLNEQIGVIAIVLALMLILMVAGFGWPQA